MLRKPVIRGGFVVPAHGFWPGGDGFIYLCQSLRDTGLRERIETDYRLKKAPLNRPLHEDPLRHMQRPFVQL